MALSNIIRNTQFEQTNLFERLVTKEAKIAIIGLGNVGLSLAMYMASKFKVIGYDINKEKISQIQRKKDPNRTLRYSEDFHATDMSKLLELAQFYIIAVPAPIDVAKEPNLIPLKRAIATVARNLKKGDIVVFESTVYPGCTEEICIPILEQISGLVYNKDFYVGYSPECINANDDKCPFPQIKKIISASDNATLDTISKVYKSVIDADTHTVSSMRVAEAAKIVENIQRDVNISLMNQLSKIFNGLGMNTNEVLRAASTKESFHDYYPGLVGGKYTGVDPYYLIHKAEEMNIESNLLKQARSTNESMVSFVVSMIIDALKSKKVKAKQPSVLVKGITFKENVNDIRNSKSAELCLALAKAGFQVVVQDNHAYASEVKKQYGFELNTRTNKIFDVIVMAVDHDNYKKLTYQDYLQNARMNTLFFDIKGDKKNIFPTSVYMSL